MAGRNQFRAAQFIEAIQGTGPYAKPDKHTGCMGIISQVADRLGCSWHTAKKYCTRRTTPFVTVAYAFEAEAEKALDFAETQMYKVILGGDGPMIRYLLSTKGKNRGYVMQVEQRHAGPGGGPIQTESINSYGPAEHARAIAALVQALRPDSDQADGGEQDAVGASVGTPVARDSEPSG